jgi:glycosyltransferase involved in cell wall biosynthesis
VRILLVTAMWPSPEHPDLGSFLVPVRRELELLGHEIDLVAISRRGGGGAPRTEWGQLCADAVARARRNRPDVVFAHFLFPTGAAGAFASIATRAPLVVMAHGQDVANLGAIRGALTATRGVVARAAAVIANSRWLAERLSERIPAARSKVEIASCGVDLGAFQPLPADRAREELRWHGDGPAFVCVGSLIERKNVVRLADAFERLGRGRLAFVGDGPLRGLLEGRANIRITGRLPQAEVPRWIAAADVLCQPSLVEPFGQATLEGMAMERTVVATAVGGPPEFVPSEAGLLVDPHDTSALSAALTAAAELPAPNKAAREAAAVHDVRHEAALMAEILERAVRS